ncbi:uncharacterized protein RB166_011685 [Leptodactylus fuscus]|uniref:uncharacterized protein LOC142210789 n=1 Tax=Leptodactylus fuscus TaxID=238119 RepID=UPI003F4F023F
MGFHYLNFGSYWKNITSPLTYWHRGTAFQFEVMKDHPKIPVALTDLGTDVVMVTMAARFMQSFISLAKNFLQKRILHWKMFPRVCMNMALQATLEVCWNFLNLLLPWLMVTVYKKKMWMKMFNTERPMNTVTIECHWGSEPEKIEEMCSLQMTTQEVAKMEVEHEGMVSEEVLSSCTNPVILSMICMPSEHEDSSEESEMDIIFEGSEGDCSQEMSVDSDIEEPWTPKSKHEDDSSEESDWSDDDDGSWDEESNSCNGDEDLWASFCRSDDPYNPLSFAMPTSSTGQPKKEAPIKTLEKCQILGNLPKILCGTVTEKTNSKKPVLTGYKSSHKCIQQKEELPEDHLGTKRVRFSPKVTVRPIITWNFAHRMARKGPWEEYARDRCRFQKRIAETEKAIGFCLESRHRDKIWARLHSK